MYKIRFFFFFILGIFLFHWVYKFFAGQQAMQLILDNKYKLFLLIFAHIPTLYFDTLAWLVLMCRNKLSINSGLIITWISQTSSKFLPTGSITGEIVRFYLAKKSGQNFSEASSTVLMDLFIATFSLFLIGLSAFIFIINAHELKTYGSLYLFFSLFLILLGCFFFFLIIRKRIISKLIRKIPRLDLFRKLKVQGILRLDFALFRLSFQKTRLFKALLFRLLGWIAGAFEIYVFLWIIGIDAKILDVVLIESVTAIIRSLVFFVPAGLGVQELAFVMIGEFVGYSGFVSFSIAMGRRLREIMVGIPAILAWFLLFKKKI